MTQTKEAKLVRSLSLMASNMATMKSREIYVEFTWFNVKVSGNRFEAFQGYIAANKKINSHQVNKCD